MTKEAKAGLFGGGALVPLLGVDVQAEVVAGHARAVVRQRYKNNETVPIEAVYTFPLPTKAVLTGFAMSVEGRRMVGEVHEREEAFRRYDDAITAGHGSALLEQERPNVFTANVGNLLPGEETVIEIEYVEPVRADEGAIRWSIPTLVAPRYMPGSPSGDRTGHGTADPTTSVPDADRISPPIGTVHYGLALDLVFDVGVEVDVECASHEVTVTKTGKKTRVTFKRPEVALDRDVVVTAFASTDEKTASGSPLASVVANRSDKTKPGTFGLALVPDLGAWRKEHATNEVVFVLDRSGSMGGPSIEEARTALRLCLRQLREGDRFAILAFDDSVEAFAPTLVPLSPATLARADTWIASIEARGGTELLGPMMQAAALAPAGVIVLLTDGQVGNEAQIQHEFMAKRGTARVYSFGIGTNVSDALLIGLAKETTGAVEMIHPGERVDDKVIAQFARATAPRVTDLAIKFRGVEVGELAPSSSSVLVDGEPFTLFGTYDEPGIGAVEIRGTFRGETFFLEVPVNLPEKEDRPVVSKLWAQARIKDLETAALEGRRADAMKARIITLAKEHGVSSKYTSFVVVEKRTGDRRVSGQPETRVVPVNTPADWEMFKTASRSRSHGPSGQSAGVRRMVMPAMSMRAMPPPAAARGGIGAPAGAPPPMSRSVPRPAPGMPMPQQAAPRPSMAKADHASRESERTTDASELYDMSRSLPSLADDEDANMATGANHAACAPAEALAEKDSKGLDPIVMLLSRQSASGLWEEPGKDALAITIDVLLVLLREGVTAAHAVHGAQVKKAVEALLGALEKSPTAPPRQIELALGVAWLLSSGRRTRRQIEDATRANASLVALAATLGNEASVRAHVDAIC